MTALQKYKIISEKKRTIAELKNELETYLYKTQENIECEKIGLPLPYSWQDIHNEAQAIRDQIKALEADIEALGVTT